jgi:hypothetical protein
MQLASGIRMRFENMLLGLEVVPGPVRKARLESKHRVQERRMIEKIERTPAEKSRVGQNVSLNTHRSFVPKVTSLHAIGHTCMLYSSSPAQEDI